MGHISEGEKPGRRHPEKGYAVVLTVSKGKDRAVAITSGKSKPRPEQGQGGRPGSLNGSALCFDDRVNQRPQDLYSTPLWLRGSRAHLPSTRESAGLEFHCLEQSPGSGVSVGANCLFGLARVARLASRQPAHQLGEPDQRHRWLWVCCHVSCSSGPKPVLPTG